MARARAPRSTREKILSLFGRERQVYNRSTRAYEPAPVRVRDVARLLRVDRRTVQRWKNQGVEPSRATRRGVNTVARLDRAASRAIQATARELRSDKRRHRTSIVIDPARVPVLPRGYRRQLKRYRHDRRGNMRATGELYDSTWINYNVRGWRFREVAGLLVQIWRQRRPWQYIYEVPAGGQLPKSGSKPPRTVQRVTRSGTAPINPDRFRSEGELVDHLSQYLDFEQGMKSRRLLYVAVDDHMPRFRQNE